MADAGRWRQFVWAVALAGCGSGGGEGAGEQVRREGGGARGAPPEHHVTPAPDSNHHPSTATATAATPCPPTGLWATCSFLKRLEQAGLAPETSQTSVTEPPLQQQGTGYSVRLAKLELYLYPHRAARERDQARLDRSRYISPDQAPAVFHKPTLITSENLLLILDTRNERQRERIALAITAGPPQPPDR